VRLDPESFDDEIIEQGQLYAKKEADAGDCDGEQGKISGPTGKG